MSTEIREYERNFESLRRQDDQGEYWSARDLMPYSDYTNWRNWNLAINRARTALSGLGEDPRSHFSMLASKTPDQRGRPAQDMRLSRRACYLTFMNGDPSKPAIAAAQNYFAEKTRQMEVIEQAPTARSIQPIPNHIEALRGWADALEAQQTAELKAAEAKAEADMLRPPAEAWNHLVNADKDYAMAEAAAILNNDPVIDTGRDRLRDWMLRNRMLYRNADGQLVPYSEHLKHIRLKPRTRPNHEAEDLRVRKEAPAQVRITPDGLSWIQQRMRDQTRPELLATIPAQRAPEEIEPPINFDQYRMDRYQALKALQRR